MLRWGAMPPSTRRQLDAWRDDPNPWATVQLCETLASWRGLHVPLANWLANEATALHPDDVPVLVGVGHVLLVAGELARAKELLLRAAASEPERLATFRVLGEVMLRSGDCIGFERVLRHAAALRRATPEPAPAPMEPMRDPFELSFDTAPEPRRLDDDEPTNVTSMAQILAAAHPEADAPHPGLEQSGDRPCADAPVPVAAAESPGCAPAA